MDAELIDGKGDNLAAVNGAPVAEVPAASASRETQSDACRRWRNAGIDLQVATFRDRMRTDYIADHPGCKRRAAHDYAWERALAEFPPPGIAVPPPAEPAPEPEPAPVILDPPAVVDSPPAAPELTPASPGGGLAGLGDIPAAWPELAANAALPAEVGWVQANRLRVVQGGGVDLSRSLSPAPSHAALSWLETSILFPAKWADVCVKATQGSTDDQEDVRRERLALGDVRTLLVEATNVGSS